MKRTAATLALLAGFGGGCMSTDNSAKKEQPIGGFGTVTRGQQVPGVVGPNGEPVMAARAAAPSNGVTQAGGTVSSGGIQQAALFSSAGSTTGDCPTCATVPGTNSMPLWNSSLHTKMYAAANGQFGGGPGPGPAMPPSSHGILPVPGQGPPGAVAAVGALPLNGGPQGVVLGRTSLRFTGPAGMKITWQIPGGGFSEEATGLTAPKEYNFMQGQVYRLRLTQILPNFPGRSFYPTLEVAPGNPKTLTFLAHCSVPLTFTNEDFEQARAGNLVVKVIYLPDRENQDFATVAGAEELVSTRLEPGADPVAEAQRRGSIMAIVRMGSIDLENKASPAMTALPGAGGPPRTGPIMLPGPLQTMPGAPIAPLTPPKPLVPGPTTPVKPPVPPPASSSNLTAPGSSSIPSVPSVPTAAKPVTKPVAPPAPMTEEPNTGAPSSLPSIVPGGPFGLSIPPASLPPAK